MRSITLSAVSIAIFVLTGCATTVASKTQTFSVSSNPEGAQVLLNGQPVGVTPAHIEIPRKLDPLAIEVSMPGRQTQVCPVQHSAGGGYVAPDVVMCVLLFPIGCVAFVDADGSWNELNTGACNVTLPPLVTPNSPAATVPSTPPVS
jgi:hypothetical protein